MLQPGTRLDRYGSNRGSFVSPAGTPFENRGLLSSRASDPYSLFTVQKPITVRGGIAAPWMDSPGGGVQYLLPRSVQELLEGGFLG
ncbi:TNT domain-containing protein [Demequina maris]|uniref:TNT domain-containing protein n=1 Tax=Demequina maris TaxID=1638982 RepID=UPI0034E2E465